MLAPPFIEWLMGLPPGWVTAEHLALPRTAQLRALGNGVMPAQAAHALRLLLDDLTHLHRAPRRPPAGNTADHQGARASRPPSARNDSAPPPSATRTPAAARGRHGAARSPR